MKKLLSILCCTVIIAAFSSCKKEYYTQVSPNITKMSPIAATDWVLSSDGKSYYAPIKVDELSGNATNAVGIIVSISYSDGVYEQLPEVYGGISFSYTYNQGNITIYAQSPDGTTAVKPTDPITAKIVLVDSN